MICCLVIDFTYLHKEVFSSKMYFMLYNLIIAFRIFFTVILMTFWIGSRVCGKAGKIET